TTRAGVNSLLVASAASPIGPAPTITTVSPGATPPFRTPTSYDVGRMSASSTASSLLTLSGSLYTDRSANGTRTCSACVPSIRWPRIQPPPPRHCPYVASLQYLQLPPAVMHETSTRSPTATRCREAPTSTTVPTASCPSTRPGVTSGTSP